MKAVFHSPLLQSTTPLGFFTTVLPELVRAVDDKQLHSRLLANEQTLSETDFDTRNKPIQLDIYREHFKMAVETRAESFRQFLIKEGPSDPALLFKITQITPGTNGNPPTRQEEEQDREYIYLNAAQTLVMLKFHNPNFDPPAAQAQRATYLRTESNALPQELVTPYRTSQSVVIQTTQIMRDRATANPLVTLEAKMKAHRKESLIMAELDYGLIDTTQSAELQIAAITSKLSATQRAETSEAFKKAETFFNTLKKTNIEITESILSLIALALPGLKFNPVAFGFFKQKAYHLIIPELIRYYAVLANSDAQKFEQALQNIKHNPNETVHIAVTKVKEILAAMQYIRAFAMYPLPLPLNFTIDAVTEHVLTATDVQWAAVFTISRIKTQDEMYILVWNLFGSDQKFASTLPGYYINHPPPDPINRSVAKIISICSATETALGLTDTSNHKGRNNGPPLQAHAVQANSSALVKHDPKTFKANAPDMVCKTGPKGGMNYFDMINNTKPGCNAHQTDTHSSAQCKAVEKGDLTCSKHHVDTLVSISTGLPVYFKSPKGDKTQGTGKQQNGNGTGKRSGSGKDSNPTSPKDAKLDSTGGRGSGGKNGGRGNSGGRGRGNGKVQTNNVEIADCSHCLKARSEHGTAAVPESESLKHSPSECPKHTAQLAVTVANSVTTALSPLLSKLMGTGKG